MNKQNQRREKQQISNDVLIFYVRQSLGRTIQFEIQQDALLTDLIFKVKQKVQNLLKIPFQNQLLFSKGHQIQNTKETILNGGLNKIIHVIDKDNLNKKEINIEVKRLDTRKPCSSQMMIKTNLKIYDFLYELNYGISVEKLFLVWGGRILNSQLTFQQEKIPNNSTIYCLHKDYNSKSQKEAKVFLYQLAKTVPSDKSRHCLNRINEQDQQTDQKDYQHSNIKHEKSQLKIQQNKINASIQSSQILSNNLEIDYYSNFKHFEIKSSSQAQKQQQNNKSSKQNKEIEQLKLQQQFQEYIQNEVKNLEKQPQSNLVTLLNDDNYWKENIKTLQNQPADTEITFENNEALFKDDPQAVESQNGKIQTSIYLINNTIKQPADKLKQPMYENSVVIGKFNQQNCEDDNLQIKQCVQQDFLKSASVEYQETSEIIFKKHIQSSSSDKNRVSKSEGQIVKKSQQSAEDASEIIFRENIMSAENKQKQTLFKKSMSDVEIQKSSIVIDEIQHQQQYEINHFLIKGSLEKITTQIIQRKRQYQQEGGDLIVNTSCENIKDLIQKKNQINQEPDNQLVTNSNQDFKDNTEITMGNSKKL